MDEARDVAGISIPFTAGIAAGLYLTGGTCAGFLPAAIQSVLFLSAAAAFTMAAICRPGRSVIAAAFMLTGMFCAAASTAGMMTLHIDGKTASKCAAALKSLIDSIPFESQETGALVKALLTGDRSDLSREVISIFRNSGASHILALSGLHLGIIYMLVSKILTLAGNSAAARRARCGCIIIAAGFYVLMTGAGPSITRAFLFICIRELSGLSNGRRQEPTRTLMMCLTIQLALSPRVLTSVGFQLSYLAMCGIVTVLPTLQSWYPETGGRPGLPDPMRWIWNAAAMAISCQLFTAPLSWLRFHTFPQYFLITNILSLPITSASMVLSVAVIILTAAGICPEMLVRADERMLTMLTDTLEIICSL